MVTALERYDAAFRAWVISVRRRRRAVVEGKLSARVAAKRNTDEEERMMMLHDAVCIERHRAWLSSLSFRAGRWRALRAVPSVAYLSV